MKRLAHSIFIPFLLAACAENPPGVPRTAGEDAPPKQPSTRITAAVARRAAPPPTLKAGATEDLDEYHLRMLALAQAQFETFTDKAGHDPRFAEAVRRSRDHIDDIKKTREFLAAGPD